MIELDPEKDAANIAKHGVSLSRSSEVDLRAALINGAHPGDDGEARWIAYGHLADRLHVLIFTIRRERIRAISLRKANRREQKYAVLRMTSPNRIGP